MKLVEGVTYKFRCGCSETVTFNLIEETSEFYHLDLIKNCSCTYFAKQYKTNAIWKKLVLTVEKIKLL